MNLKSTVGAVLALGLFSGNWNPNADLNGDGVVSLADFGILRANFGRQGDP